MRTLRSALAAAAATVVAVCLIGAAVIELGETDPNSEQVKAQECSVLVQGRQAGAPLEFEYSPQGPNVFFDPVLSGTPNLKNFYFLDHGMRPLNWFRQRIGFVFILHERARRTKLSLSSNDCSKAFRAAGLRLNPGKAERSRLARLGDSVTLIQHRRPIVGPGGMVLMQPTTFKCEYRYFLSPPGQTVLKPKPYVISPTTWSNALGRWDGSAWSGEGGGNLRHPIRVYEDVNACEDRWAPSRGKFWEP